ncbi:hypothetical protein IMAU30143_02157 [Lactobacillus helveticus]|nr:hypothetical protein [Lactobacillus helveticus]
MSWKTEQDKTNLELLNNENHRLLRLSETLNKENQKLLALNKQLNQENQKLSSENQKLIDLLTQSNSLQDDYQNLLNALQEN